MSNPSNKGNGKTFKWLLEHVSYKGDDCLKWPFAMDNAHGRGRLGYLGKHYWAHRLMCILAKGKPPTPKHQTAHSCGNGNKGCINPQHLSWKTNAQNQLDRRKHGTQMGAKGNRAKLTQEQIAEIRRLQGIETQFSLAERFGVKRGCIEYWQRTTHNPVPPG